MATTSTGQSPDLRHLALTSLAAVLSLAVGLLLFLSTGHDDAYITFWSAHALLQFGEIVNYGGARVEQRSSLLHTLWLAGAAGITQQPVPVVGYWTGIFFGVLGMFRAQALCGRLGWNGPAWLPFLLGTVPIYLYWWFGGLETTLAAWLTVEVAIVASDLLSARRRARSVSVLLVTAAYLMVRPETFLVLLSALAGWLLLDRLASSPGGPGPRPGARELRRWMLGVAGLYLVLVIFRLGYFGQVFPQPVYAKVGGGGLDTVVAGLVYYAKGSVLRPYALTFFAASIGAVALGLRAARRREPGDARLFALLMLGANAAFVLFAGGDWMRGGRFFAVFVPLALVVGVGALREFGPGPRGLAALLILAFCANGAGMLALALGEASGRPLWRFLERDPLLREHGGSAFHWSERANRVRTRDVLFVGAMNRVVDELLERTEPVTIMSRQAGMVMYYVGKEHFGRIRFIDVYGLTTPDAIELGEKLEIGRRSTGTQLTPARMIEALERERGASSRPDVVFDIYPTAPALAALGFETVYEQTGQAPGIPLRIGPWGPFEIGYSVYEFVAVATRWAALFPDRPERLRWSAVSAARGVTSARP